MGNRGHLKVNLPNCDIPINHLFVSLFLPENYKYGEFTGLREVNYWTSQPPTSNGITPPPAPILAKKQKKSVGRKKDKMNKKKVYKEKEMKVNKNYDLELNYLADEKEQRYFGGADSESESDGDDDDDDDDMITAGGGGLSLGRGVIPVRVDAPMTGKEFRFEHLILNDDKSLSVSVEYKKSGSGSSRRKEGCCC
jgi:hypothetical protein